MSKVEEAEESLRKAYEDHASYVRGLFDGKLTYSAGGAHARAGWIESAGRAAERAKLVAWLRESPEAGVSGDAMYLADLIERLP